MPGSATLASPHSVQRQLPRRLAGTGTLGLVAPSGHISDPERLEAAIQHFERRGWRVKRGANLLGKWKYFSATDAERVAELHAMASDPDVDVVMAVRGGYGLSRLLHHIDYALLARSGKVFVGFSDFTALNLALLATQNYVSLSGPLARVDFGNEQVLPLMEDNFWPLLTRPEHVSPTFACVHPYAPHTLEGTLWGTNLTLVAHLIGTPYLPVLDDGILVVEDIGEEPYHLERCFWQLKHAGVLARQRAILLGRFNGFDPASEAAQRLTLDDMLETLRAMAACPVLTGFPFGHCAEKISVPVGGKVRVEIREAGYQLALSAFNAAPAQPL